MPLTSERGFTLIELLLAMTVFSFMLLIIVVGFINVVHIHNEALASNAAQDSARSAMDTLVQAVRDSTGTPTFSTGVAPGLLSPDFDVMCLQTLSGPEDFYVAQAAPGSPAQIMRGDVATCGSAPTNVQPLTSDNEMVTYFKTTPMTTGPTILKPEIQLQITLGSANGTASVVGPNGSFLQCNNNNADRVFCATVSLTSGAVPR